MFLTSTREVIKQTITELFNSHVGAALDFTRNQGSARPWHTVLRPSDVNLVQSLCFLLDHFLKDVFTPFHPPFTPASVPFTPTGNRLPLTSSSNRISLISLYPF